MNINTNGEEAAQRRTAASLPFKTLQGIVATLKSRGLPHRIDRSIFRTFSGAMTAQALQGLRFLSLIGEDGSPLSLLHQIVDAPEGEHPGLYRLMLEQAYPDLFALDLSKATYGMFEQTLGASYNVSGSTRKKAARFFLSAAEFAGISLSAHMHKPKVSDGQPVRRRRVTNSVSVKPSQVAGASSPLSNIGAQIVLRFESAQDDELRVTFTGNPFVLSSADRRFLNSILDAVQRYANGETNIYIEVFKS